MLLNFKIVCASCKKVLKEAGWGVKDPGIIYSVCDHCRQTVSQRLGEARAMQ
jgi:hypothetical protein